MFATALIVTVLTASSVDTTYAFVGVSVIPMDRERVLENQTVVVQGGQVVALGPASSIQVPRGAVAIDGRGRYLMPGLAEMHAHIPSPPQATMAFAEEVLFLYAAGGVTTIRGMLGNPVHLDLRQRVASGEVLGPQIWTSSPSINGNSVRTPAQADSAVRGSKAAGYDFLKIHPGVSREAFDRLDATADEVGIPFSGHVPAAVGIFRALEARYASIDHLDGYIEGLVTDDPAGANLNSGWFGANIADQVDMSRIPDIARRTREAGVWNVPTQTLAESSAPA